MDFFIQDVRSRALMVVGVLVTIRVRLLLSLDMGATRATLTTLTINRGVSIAIKTPPAVATAFNHSVRVSRL